MDKVKCSICLEKDAKIVTMPHWKTGLVQPFVEGTCGHPSCVAEYEEAMEILHEEGVRPDTFDAEVQDEDRH